MEIDIHFWLDKLSILATVTIIIILGYNIISLAKERRYHRIISFAIAICVCIIFIISRGTYSPRNTLPNVSFSNESHFQGDFIETKPIDKHSKILEILNEKEERVYESIKEKYQ